ncbi:MAG: Gfo/Idh/MocA family oxidoreductase [Planctomycetes bacterium]|nr:Gfo/Idh/MocA family oxidoreductase [Planctomycetota bacterium]
MSHRIRIGLIGAGANTRLRHIPGLMALEGVELAAVCNRRPESSHAIAREFSVPRVFEQWEQLVADPDIDAIVIGTWPYLHFPITVAALQAGKHVLTEARLSMNAAEAHHMLKAARQHGHLVTQVVPSPFGLKGHDVMLQLIGEGYLGELREVHVCHFQAPLADREAPLSWRQDAKLSGFNMLTLGIVHETLSRWVPAPVEVQAQIHAHIATRIDPQSGVYRAVGTPDSVQVLAILANGARAAYHFSGVTPFGQTAVIHLFGRDGMLEYDLLTDRIRGASRMYGHTDCRLSDLHEIEIPPEAARGWNVEADFIAAIRDGRAIEFTTFEAGVAYMEFTEAVARSAESGESIALPLGEFT